MSWKAYELIYKALSPVHIGRHKLGIIQRTRYYIPARTFWGAATAKLAQAKLVADKKLNIDKVYKNAGDKVAENCLFSYFFPAIRKENNKLSAYLPGDKNLEYHLISSYTSTAIEAKTNSAEEGSLHETEYISHLRKTDSKQIYFWGYLFIRQEKEQKWDDGDLPLKDIWSSLSIGGERKYGFGQLVLENDPVPLSSYCLWNQESLRINENGLNGNWPLIQVADGQLLAHLVPTVENSFIGNIEPLVGRVWSTGGAGQALSSAVIGYAPGTEVSGEHLFEMQGGSTKKIGGIGYGCWRFQS